MAIHFNPSWVNGISGGISNVEVVKNVAELQAHFFNWLYDSEVEITSQRLPTTDPLPLFKALMHVNLPQGSGTYLMDLILNLVEKPSTKPDIQFLWCQDLDPTQHLEWVFNTENGITSFSMGLCDKHLKSFSVGNEELAKLLFMTELFLHMRNTIRTTDGTPVTAQLFKSQPILTAFYAAHVTAYNL